MKNLLTATAVLLLAAPAAAVSPHDWDTAGTVVEAGLVATALGLSVVRSDWTGVKDLGLTLGVAGGSAYLLKTAVHEERPDGSGDDSFPSGHTTIAFAAAGYMQARYGWQIGLPAAVAASFVGFTRVQSKQHHWYDVVAGAAIGEGAGLLLTGPWNDQVQVMPWGDSKGGGIAMSARF